MKKLGLAVNSANSKTVTPITMWCEIIRDKKNILANVGIITLGFWFSEEARIAKKDMILALNLQVLKNEQIKNGERNFVENIEKEFDEIDEKGKKKKIKKIVQENRKVYLFDHGTVESAPYSIFDLSEREILEKIKEYKMVDKLDIVDFTNSKIKEIEIPE